MVCLLFMLIGMWQKNSNLRLFLTEISLTLSLITLYIFGCSLRRCSFQGYYLPRLSDPFRQLSLKHFVSKVIPNSCGHVVRDFESEAKIRCNFQSYSKLSLILRNFQKWQCAGPQKQIQKSRHTSFVFLDKKI